MTPHALQGSPERCRELFLNAGDFYTKALHVPTPDCRTSSDTQKHRLQALTCNRCIFMQWRIKSPVRCGYRPGAASFPAVCRLVGCPAPAGADGCTGSFDRRSRMQRSSAFSARMPAGWSESLRRNSPPWEKFRLCCKQWRRFGLNRGKWLPVTSLEKRSEIPFIFFLS